MICIPPHTHTHKIPALPRAFPTAQNSTFICLGVQIETQESHPWWVFPFTNIFPIISALTNSLAFPWFLKTKIPNRHMRVHWPWPPAHSSNPIPDTTALVLSSPYQTGFHCAPFHPQPLYIFFSCLRRFSHLQHLPLTPLILISFLCWT